MKFVLVDQVTEGAACTALLARAHINNDDPVFIVNSDQFVEWDADAFWKDRIAGNAAEVDGDILCFHVPMEENDIKWSYAALDDKDHVTEIREKEVISENATVGFYYWSRGNDFVESAEAMIAANARVKGEFYVAPVYNFGVSNFQRKYTVSYCKKMWGLGVPADLVSFLSEFVRPRIDGKILQDHEPLSAMSNGPLRFIAHRGNVFGANPALENQPEYIDKALKMGFDVEVDAWFMPETGKWWLGHDEPQYETYYEYLLTDGMWVHCKNGAALQVLSQDDRAHCFFHDRDDYTITSRGVMWAYPDQPMLGPRSIAVMYSQPEALLDQQIGGVCQDNVGELRDKYTRMNLSSNHVNKRIRLVIFDLDGVLVESCDLHYEALNQALLEVAGSSFVISREEHLFIYDGLSTNQKLHMLTESKDLDPKLHKAVWQRKQDLTEEMVKTTLGPSDHILEAISGLKKNGFAVAVASNCIRSSVKTILETIDVMRFIDVYVSNEDVENAKPAPDIYLKACKSFCVDPSEALVVEDTVKGFEAASRAGCSMLRVKDPNDTTISAAMNRIRELELPSQKITVVVPLAGPTPEMWLQGRTGNCSEAPVFLADAAGRPTLYWIMDSLRSRRYQLQYVFLIKATQSRQFQLEALCAAAVDYQPFKVELVKRDTLGSLQTILQCSPDIVPSDSPLLIADGHHLVDWGRGSIDDLLSSPADGSIAVNLSSDPRDSYVSLLPGDTLETAVAEIHIERNPVSQLACSGLYFYRKAADFWEAANHLVSQNQRSRGVFYTAPTFNDMISEGKRVDAVKVVKSWSLQSASEVRDFTRYFVPWGANERQTDIYNEMEKRQMKNVIKGGLKFDDNLLHEADPRKCMAVYSLCDHENFVETHAFVKVQKQLKELLGDGHCFYEPAGPNKSGESSPLDATLHWTLMQLIGFQAFDKIKVPAEYKDVVEVQVQRYLPRVKINFSRLVLTPSNILMVGYPSVDVNTSRINLRRALNRNGMPLFEPYINDLVHTTLVRFASPIEATKIEPLVRILEGFKNVPLASMQVDSMSISPATWRMQKRELEAQSPCTIELH